MLRAQFKRNLMGIYRLLFYVIFIQLLYNEREREQETSQPQDPIQTQQKL